jgi:hypothetical protein
MNLATTLELHAGGPGSGCNPDKGKCGRPRTSPTDTGKGLAPQRQAIKDVHKTLAEAGRRKMAVYVKYRFEDGGSKTYLVEPYSYRGDRFFGFDLDHKVIKAFKLLQVERVTISDKAYKPRWKIELAAATIAAMLAFTFTREPTTLYAGGPGSGCNPQKGTCGRPRGAGAKIVWDVSKA